MPVELALGERRIGEQRGGDRLQRHRHAHLLHHVRLGPEIEVHLHRAGPAHHLGAVGAHGAHVGVHQPVPPLGHQRHLVVGPDRGRAQPDEARTDIVGHGLYLGQMAVHLVAGLVNRLERRAGQLQLAAGFEADVRLATHEPGQLAALGHLGPAEPVAQARQHRMD